MWQTIRTVLFLLLWAGGFTFLHASSPLYAAEGQKALLILDGSGSMWGRINGKYKFQIAQRSLQPLYSALGKRMPFGVLAYGHRYKGNCQDVELLAPVSVSPITRYRKAVRAVAPVGKTPIATALEAAARAINYRAGKSAIILLSDGIENCERDPCAVASNLKRTGPALKIHVVGFGLKPGEDKKLACIAQNTGGIFRAASDEAQLSSALKTVVTAIISPGQIPPTPKKIETSKGPKRKQAPSAKGPAGLSLTAFLKPGGPQVKEAIAWTIYQSGTPDRRKKIKTLTGSNPIIKLPPGKYYIEARYGQMRTGREIAISRLAKAQRENLIFNAGKVQLQAKDRRGGKLLEQVSYQIFAKRTDGQIAREPILRSNDATKGFLLPAGEYLAVAEHGHSSISQPITVKAGNLTNVTLVMNLGMLELVATSTPGGSPLKHMFYTVYKARRDGETRGEEVLRTAANQPRIRLPAGNYLIRAAYGQARKAKWVSINPGLATRSEINMNAGILKISSKLPNASEPPSDPISYRLYSEHPNAQGKLEEIARTSQPGKIFRLPAGSYRIVGRLGNINAKTTARAIIKPGQTTTITLEHKAGLVTPILVKSGGGQPTQSVFWLIKDEKGKELWRTSHPKPRFALAPGAYILITEHNGRQVKTRFSVAMGDKKTLKITAN